MVTNWKLPENPELGFAAQILSKRELSEDQLSSDLSQLPDEALLSNIEAVADRIRKAMYHNEPLIIFGHDDPDGVTSTYILYQFLSSCGYQKHNYYIPNRNLDSHGIQDSFVDFVREGRYKLVVTVDNGISSIDGVRKLNDLGCDTIITDHHLIQPESLPPAYAILNPQLPECKYPFKSLAGVGVVLVLIRYLGKKLDHPISPASYFWTAIGSLADKVTMTGLNRVLVRHVIDNWDSINDSSIEFLQRNYNRLGTKTDIFNFMQNTARLIANGREDRGQHIGLSFMLQMGHEKARLFQKLERQKKVWETELNRVFAFLDTILGGFGGDAFIYYDDDDVIPYSLLGTASSYIVNKLGIPTIMLKHYNGHLVCEGRCSDGFNMVDAFTHCKAHLKQYGGHVKAAGFTMLPESYDGFLECFNEYLGNNTQHTDRPPGTAVDAIATVDDLNEENWNFMESLLPFGQQNPEPAILLRNIDLAILQQRFDIDYNSMNIPVDRSGDALINWKGLRTIRILDFVRK
ncbi:MAG: DHH family phosphoesterase [Candidatus Cloacimonadaceae bacterium]|nr:DHH family phosphoesterase [Candidatus Cloacimonadaceae bacterium]MDP3114662.1 DHH family phosphoesterase [Candidatus Cloacimonadaceae bacterium]